MSTTVFNPLQKQAIDLLASGKSPQMVRDQLALSTSLFEAWRQSDEFVAEVERQATLYAAKTTTERQQAADTQSQDAVEAEINKISAR